MTPTLGSVRGAVNAGLLAKADRLFLNSDDSIFVELLQNARRAGATTIRVSIDDIPGNKDQAKVVVSDNGKGIEDFQTLLTLGNSGWNSDTQEREDPAGMGFFSLCRSEVEVESGHQRVMIGPAVFLGQAEAQIELAGEFIQGTRIAFARHSTSKQLLAALQRVAEFCPLEVWIGKAVLERHDFMEGALHRELIDGIEVGFSNQFRWRHHQYSSQEPNWNFYGALVYHAFDSLPGLLGYTTDGSSTRLYARFNVLETARIKLQLPDRRGVIQDGFLAAFESKAKAAAYRYFRNHREHLLPFRYWKQAKELGVELPEAAPILTCWHARPADENEAHIFGIPEERRVNDCSTVILIDRDLPNAHTLEGALHSGATLDGEPFEDKHDFAGYSWYDALPKVTEIKVLIDGRSDEQWERSTRPKQIDLELTVEQSQRPSSTVRLPATIHVWPDFRELDFVAVEASPWDNDKLAGPFCVVEFLMWATFSSSHDSDLWETQRDNYLEDVEREVNRYFRGAKATLLALLCEALPWDVRQLLEELSVTEVRFTRKESKPVTWDIALVSEDAASVSSS